MKILFVSLGCDKNLVDTEEMLGLLGDNGFELTDDEEQAEIIIINTCCFIHDAKKESIETILENTRGDPGDRRNSRYGFYRQDRGSC